MVESKEKAEIEDFIAQLEDYQTTIPDEITTYYLNRTGFVCSDIKMKRLIALATQKFISNIADDALQYCKIRQQAAGASRAKEKKLILTMEDLTQSLKEKYGVNLRKPDYYADKTTAGLEVAQREAREKEKERVERRGKQQQQAKEKKEKEKEKDKDDKDGDDK